jgi:hypothetical protein
VYAALESFWTERDRQILTTALRPPPEAVWDEYLLYQRQYGWTLLEWDGGWEWELRREAQLRVSRVLGCSGLLVFVYDGDYWGYEPAGVVRCPVPSRAPAADGYRTLPSAHAGGLGHQP